MPRLEQLSLNDLQNKADYRLDKLYYRDKDAWDRCVAYIERFYYDIPSLIEFIQDYDKGVYN